MKFGAWAQVSDETWIDGEVDGRAALKIVAAVFLGLFTEARISLTFNASQVCWHFSRLARKMTRQLGCWCAVMCPMMGLMNATWRRYASDVVSLYRH